MSHQDSGSRFWLAAGATAAGVNHVRSGVPNQDYYSYRLVRIGMDPVAVLAVADPTAGWAAVGAGFVLWMLLWAIFKM